MKELSERIAKQSKVVLILAKVARIILYVTLGLMIYVLIASFGASDLPIFKIGDTSVYLLASPTTLGIGDLALLPSAREEIIVQIVGLCVAQALLYLVTKLFKHIGESESPFTAETIKAMKTLGILLGVVVGIDNGYLGVVVAFVVYTFAMISEYGAALQRQVDETL